MEKYETILVFFNELEKHDFKVGWTRNAIVTRLFVYVNCFF